ncbi:MAG: HAD family phosphatase [Micrococcales bacterium]|nr:HAD family phosphatase [Micrococcales bacterium]
MIKAVVFDMDGVLIDAKEWHYEALNRALGLFGMEISRADHLSTFDGLPTHTKLSILSENRNLPTSLHKFINELKQQYTMELVHTKCRPKFVHEYALSHLVRDGYRLAVASNSIRNTVEIMMDRANLSAYLDLQLSAEDVERPKPHPDIYLAAARGLGLEPHECLVVEDNKNGIAAAKAAGANLLEVETVMDVNYDNIIGRIRDISATAEVGQ